MDQLPIIEASSQLFLKAVPLHIYVYARDFYHRNPGLVQARWYLMRPPFTQPQPFVNRTSDPNTLQLSSEDLCDRYTSLTVLQSKSRIFSPKDTPRISNFGGALRSYSLLSVRQSLLLQSWDESLEQRRRVCLITRPNIPLVNRRPTPI